MKFNRTTALIVILVLLVMVYITINWKKNEKCNSNKKKKTECIKKSDDEKDKIDDDIFEDAKQLYNLVHEGLSNNSIQLDEFEEIAEDLINDTTFINLKQLYNNTEDKSSITVKDYAKVLSSEDD